MLTITAFYAGLLGLLFFGLSIVVIRRRGTEKVSLGDGGKAVLERAIRAHGNFAEYVPLILILLGIMELNQVAVWRLHLLGGLLLVGRLLHAYCFTFTESFPPARVGGMALTFTALIIGALSCLRIALV